MDFKDRNIMGIVFCIKKDKYWENGGMCENFWGWGGEYALLWEVYKKELTDMPYKLFHPYYDHKDEFSEENKAMGIYCHEHTEEVRQSLISIKDRLGNSEGETLIDVRPT